MRFRRLISSLIILAFCQFAIAAQGPARQLTVYAATSLTNAFESLAEAFSEAEAGVEVLLNFANSSTLAAQLNAGAPADVFASANEKQMSLVVEGERISREAVTTFAHNQLVLILSAAYSAHIDSIEQLSEQSLLLVLAAPGTPIRAYTDDMLAAHNKEYGEDFTERVMRNLVSEERNVRQVVARVALGEADAGIVYQSDVIGDVADQIVTVHIDEEHNQLASYPIAALSDAADAALAIQFVDFVLSAPAQAILREFGFCSPVILDELESLEATPEPTPDAVEEPEADLAPCATQPPVN